MDAIHTSQAPELRVRWRRAENSTRGANGEYVVHGVKLKGDSFRENVYLTELLSVISSHTPICTTGVFQCRGLCFVSQDCNFPLHPTRYQSSEEVETRKCILLLRMPCMWLLDISSVPTTKLSYALWLSQPDALELPYLWSPAEGSFSGKQSSWPRPKYSTTSVSVGPHTPFRGVTWEAWKCWWRDPFSWLQKLVFLPPSRVSFTQIMHLSMSDPLKSLLTTSLAWKLSTCPWSSAASASLQTFTAHAHVSALPNMPWASLSPTGITASWMRSLLWPTL